MANSRLVEYGTAEKLYRDPEFEFTARFLGSSNVLPVTISSATEALLPGHPELLKIAPTVQAAELTAKLSLRPHRVILLAAGERAENELEMQVEEIQWRGSTHLIAGRVAGQPFAVEALELAELPHPGTTVRIGFAAADAVMLRAETRNSEGVVVALPTGSDTAADTMATGHPAGLGSLAVAS
nr:TOBE domain-containing protein [Arthrobacter jiangjiafuii]